MRWVFAASCVGCVADEVTRLDLSNLDFEYLALFRLSSAGELTEPTLVDRQDGAPKLSIEEDGAQALVVALSRQTLDGIHPGRRAGRPRVELRLPPDVPVIDDGTESIVSAIPQSAPSFVLTEGAGFEAVSPPPVSLHVPIDLEYCRDDRTPTPFGAEALLLDPSEFTDRSLIDVARIEEDRVLVLGYGFLVLVARGSRVHPSDVFSLPAGVLARVLVRDATSGRLFLAGRDTLRERPDIWELEVSDALHFVGSATITATRRTGMGTGFVTDLLIDERGDLLAVGDAGLFWRRARASQSFGPVALPFSGDLEAIGSMQGERPHVVAAYGGKFFSGDAATGIWDEGPMVGPLGYDVRGMASGDGETWAVGQRGFVAVFRGAWTELVRRAPKSLLRCATEVTGRRELQVHFLDVALVGDEAFIVMDDCEAVLSIRRDGIACRTSVPLLEGADASGMALDGTGALVIAGRNGLLMELSL